MSATGGKRQTPRRATGGPAKTSGTPKNSAAAAAAAVASPGSASKTKKRPEWQLCPASGCWFHPAQRDEHQAWLAKTREDPAAPAKHMLVQEKTGIIHSGSEGVGDELGLVLSRRVWLPTGAAALAGLTAGATVRVRNAEDSASVVLATWLHEEAAPCLRLPASVMAYLGPNQRVAVTSYRQSLKPIDRLILRPSAATAEDLPKDQNVTTIVMASIEGAVLTVGERLTIPVYTLKCQFSVESITLDNESGCANLSAAMASLDIQERPETVGVVTFATDMVISSANVEEHFARPRALPVLAGVDEEMAKVKKSLSPMLAQSRHADIPAGVILWGPSGSGKTALGESIASMLEVDGIVLKVEDILSKYLGDSEANLKKAFLQAEERQPCVLFLDGLDLLCGHSGGSGSQQSVQHSDRLASCLVGLLDDLRMRRLAIAVVASATRPAMVDARLRSAGRLDVEVELGVPAAGRRLDILSAVCDQHGFSVNREVLRHVADGCHGFVAADLRRLVNEAVAEASCGEVRQLQQSDFQLASVKVKPSAMKEVQVEVPKVTWADIGGLDELKLALKQAVSWPLKRPEAFARLGIRPPRGVLMYGPPGCSKTMVAKALANESGLNFLSVKGPELFSKWVGESERAVRELFRKARQVAPAIVFFDEIDALGSERGGGNSGVGDRVLAQLLTEMDGVEQLTGVIVVAATNR
jgi:SpoVK/Ycf46/Vps4 family AAA+-type ATPase